MNAVLKFDISQTYTLQSHEALARWEEIESLLKDIELVDTPLSHVRDMVASREAQVWCIGDPIECVLVTKVENTKDYRYGLLWLCSGDLRMIDSVHGIVENWFRSLDCKYVQITGRRGWKKLLPDYTEQSINLVKNLWEA
jgi:hypothetical protein